MSYMSWKNVAEKFVNSVDLKLFSIALERVLLFLENIV